MKTFQPKPFASLTLMVYITQAQTEVCFGLTCHVFCVGCESVYKTLGRLPRNEISWAYTAGTIVLP